MIIPINQDKIAVKRLYLDYKSNFYYYGRVIKYYKIGNAKNRE